MNLPDKKYAVIYADPPWSYCQHGTGPKSRGNAAQHYHTMTTDDICALPVRQLAGGGHGVLHVGDVPTNCRCSASYGSVGIYIQNGSFRLGKEKSEEQHKFLGHGSVHKGERRNLPAGRDTGIQGRCSDQEPRCASSDRIADTGTQRKAE